MSFLNFLELSLNVCNNNKNYNFFSSAWRMRKYHNSLNKAFRFCCSKTGVLILSHARKERRGGDWGRVFHGFINNVHKKLKGNEKHVFLLYFVSLPFLLLLLLYLLLLFLLLLLFSQGFVLFVFSIKKILSIYCEMLDIWRQRCALVVVFSCRRGFQPNIWNQHLFLNKTGSHQCTRAVWKFILPTPVHWCTIRG